MTGGVLMRPATSADPPALWDMMKPVFRVGKSSDAAPSQPRNSGWYFAQPSYAIRPTSFGT